MKKFIYIFFFFAYIQSASAQTAKAFEEAGDAAFSRKDYNAALQYFLEASAVSKENTELVWKMAETSRLYNSYALAEKNYQKIVDAAVSKKYPTALYQLALMKKYQGKYTEAKNDFGEVISDPQTPYDYAALARKEIKSADWALSVINAPKDITVEHLGKNVNTPYSEFAAVEKDNTLYYSSLRFENKEDKRDPPRLLTKVLSTTDTATAGKALNRFNAQSQHTAYTAFSKKNERVYFTNCEYSGNGEEIVCNIYFKEKDGDSWTKEERLPDFINFPGASNTMPSVGLENGQEVLYFVSNRKDGKGGMDIWYSTILPTGGFAYPINLAYINTRGDEVSPYYHSATKTLYFSSDGYETLGGLDIFSSVKQKNSFSTPRNVGAPLNSSYNDLYFNLLENGEVGYFSSNRLGSLFLDKKNETCCYDVYKAIIGKKALETPKKETPKKTTEITDVPKKDKTPKDNPKEINEPPAKTDVPPTKSTTSNNPPTKTNQIPPTNTQTPPNGTKTNIPNEIPKEYVKLEEFLPLPLFFDNDEPDKNTRSISTNKTYEQAETAYYRRKYEYVEKNLSASNREKAITTVDEFFEKTVKGNFILLQKFTPILLGRLNKGEKIEIIVKGYASPLAKNDYNNYLGKRRVASLVNFWKSYEGGLFEKYFNNGQLTITQVSFGEDTASKEVSDNERDEAASIYSIGAAKERRIEIIEVKKNN